MTYVFILVTLALSLQVSTFKEEQLKNARVKIAFREKQEQVHTYFKEKNLNPDGFYLFIRVFKIEQELEVWVREKGTEKYALLQTYPLCAMSGKPGPKRKEGDLQIPEGFYSITHFNPLSQFYLSLGINYPNAADILLGDRKSPGGEIYIHGDCVTIGCLPITDDKIKELYLLAVEAKNYGQHTIEVHIFPHKLDSQSMIKLKQTYPSPELHRFWESLEPIYTAFESTHKLTPIKIDAKGTYNLF